MRILYIILGIILLSIAFLLFIDTYINPTEKSLLNTSEVYIFTDKTGTLIESLGVTDIVPLLRFDINKYAWVKVKCFTLSNYEYNNVESIALANRFFLFSNPKKRDREIDQFIAQIDTTLESIYKTDTGKEKSSIYVPIIREANTLYTSRAFRKIIIIQSDLQENTNRFSLYNENDYALLKQSPEKVLKKLEQIEKLHTVKGLTVYLIYQPKSDKDNERFMAMATFYKALFEKQGAEVYIGSNITH
ncbi:MAG: hypothetical protein K1X55_10305 [Chitinophagales bacterium]|nr:hypothetical protein [Chitinophagales bacterium]